MVTPRRNSMDSLEVDKEEVFEVVNNKDYVDNDIMLDEQE